jgi:hypothetical protein
LFLATGKTDSSFSNNGIETFGEDVFIHDEVVAVGILASGLEHVVDLLLGFVSDRNSVKDVVLNGVGEQNRLLLHDSNLRLMVPGVVDVLQVNSIVGEFTEDRVVPALDQGDDRGLSATRGSDEGNDVVLGDLEGDIMENGDLLLGRVSEGDVLNVDLGFSTTDDVSGLFGTGGVHVTRGVNNIGNGDARSLNLSEVGNVIEHSTDIHGESLHVHEVGKDLTERHFLVFVL